MPWTLQICLRQGGVSRWRDDPENCGIPRGIAPEHDFRGKEIGAGTTKTPKKVFGGVEQALVVVIRQYAFSHWMEVFAWLHGILPPFAAQL